jgi:hypothetical protein
VESYLNVISMTRAVSVRVVPTVSRIFDMSHIDGNPTLLFLGCIVNFVITLDGSQLFLGQN